MEDLHIHIRDGIDDLSQLQKFIDVGRKNNIDTFCFLEHGNRISPKHVGYLDNYDSIDKMKKSINFIRNNNKDIIIYSGIEIDYSTELEFRNKTLNLLEYGKFDIVIGSIHNFKFDDEEKYFDYIIDMINNYPINIIGHIKLKENYKDYYNKIEEIIKMCHDKKIKIEINTSERSIWNEEQFNYMIDLLNKYNVSFTCGSDAHKNEDVGFNYKLLNRRLKKRVK